MKHRVVCQRNWLAYFYNLRWRRLSRSIDNGYVGRYRKWLYAGPRPRH